VPAVVLGAALARGRLHLRFGLSALDVLRREDDGGVLPDPLALLIAEEAEDAGVPTQDAPGGVCGEDGVVADRNYVLDTCKEKA